MIRKLFAAALLAVLAPLAHAQDWFQFEAGAGAAHMVDVGDGVWQQQGTPGNSLKLTAPALVGGLTGRAYTRGNWSVDWHADYVYLGTVSAACQCVQDADYNNQTHQVLRANAPTNWFGGQGHTQGIALTLTPGYSFGAGWRVAADVGPWVFWQTWHEHNNTPWGPDDSSHATVAQFGYVVGARVERGPFSLSYRYYAMPARWNPYPGIAKGAHVVTATWRF